MYLCINFASFYDCDIGFSNCSNSVAFLLLYLFPYNMATLKRAWQSLYHMYMY
jgi:hypothetical protein